MKVPRNEVRRFLSALFTPLQVLTVLDVGLPLGLDPDDEIDIRLQVLLHLQETIKAAVCDGPYAEHRLIV